MPAGLNNIYKKSALFCPGQCAFFVRTSHAKELEISPH
ncbi:hypothetical protein B4144_3305 [Bacillus atrophaeus]|nr:hypothetical protein B4144_3305 [Bacillus atrophaeus]